MNPFRRIIPCLDCRDGKVVKGVQFRNLVTLGDPVIHAIAYESQGADELVLLDVSATLEGRLAGIETVRAIREHLSIPLVVGGGVRDLGHAETLLEAGADKVAINSAAVVQPTLIEDLAQRFGAQCTVIAIDAARRAPTCDGYEVVVRSGSERTGRDAADWAAEATARGAGEVLLTSWDRDGTRSGYDLDLCRAVASRVSVPVIASGGASGLEHMAAALSSGADAVLAASIFHDGTTSVADVKLGLRALGIEVRLP
ncbi:MAG: Imidazole glycerol phosphate synthase subunit HisF [Planctomycetota bacterium]|jgi:imidazoleglycerol phosphate synthase cyclase subunit